MTEYSVTHRFMGWTYDYWKNHLNLLDNHPAYAKDLIADFH
ncbi:MAG: hypothetical protein RIA69_02840 [Cyclobacteriaceae bacterium]